MKQFFTRVITPSGDIHVIHMAYIDTDTSQLRFSALDDNAYIQFSDDTVSGKIKVAMASGASLENVADILHRNNVKDASCVIIDGISMEEVLVVPLDNNAYVDNTEEEHAEPFSVRDIMYIIAEKFLRRFISALENNSAEIAFKNAFSGAVRLQQAEIENAPDFSDDDTLTFSDQAIIEFYQLRLAVIGNMFRSSATSNDGVIRIDVFGEHYDTQPATVVVAKFDERGLVQ